MGSILNLPPEERGFVHPSELRPDPPPGQNPRPSFRTISGLAAVFIGFGLTGLGIWITTTALLPGGESITEVETATGITGARSTQEASNPENPVDSEGLVDSEDPAYPATPVNLATPAEFPLAGDLSEQLEQWTSDTDATDAARILANGIFGAIGSMLDEGVLLNDAACQQGLRNAQAREQAASQPATRPTNSADSRPADSSSSDSVASDSSVSHLGAGGTVVSDPSGRNHLGTAQSGANHPEELPELDSEVEELGLIFWWMIPSIGSEEARELQKEICATVAEPEN